MAADVPRVIPVTSASGSTSGGDAKQPVQQIGVYRRGLPSVSSRTISQGPPVFDHVQRTLSPAIWTP